jgi:hypothetical protein
MRDERLRHELSSYVEELQKRARPVEPAVLRRRGRRRYQRGAALLVLGARRPCRPTPHLARRRPRRGHLDALIAAPPRVPRSESLPADGDPASRRRPIGRRRDPRNAAGGAALRPKDQRPVDIANTA